MIGFFVGGLQEVLLKSVQGGKTHLKLQHQNQAAKVRHTAAQTTHLQQTTYSSEVKVCKTAIFWSAGGGVFERGAYKNLKVE